MNEQAKEIAEGLLDSLTNDLINEGGLVNSEMATTNCSMFGLDGYDFISAEFSDRKSCIQFKVEMQISGEQDEDRPFSGSKIEVVVSASAEKKGGKWEITKYKEESGGIADF